jgi:hypothetical protein
MNVLEVPMSAALVPVDLQRAVDQPSSGRLRPTMARDRHLAAAVIFTLCLSCAASGAAEISEIQQRPPAVDCPVNDQPPPAKPQTGLSMAVPLDPRLSAQIAYYSAAHTPGVYAPKGWSCRAWDGSNGSILVVTPTRIAPPYFPLPVITGPGVVVQSSDAEGSGRFHVAIVAAQLFPLVGDEFIARVRQEHLIADSSFNAEPYPDDQVQYLSDRLVQFTTPPNRAGLGTDGMFETSDLAVRGLIILNLEDATNSLTEVRVRLAGGLNSIAAAIVQLETTCIQVHGRCRGFQ